MPLDHGNMCRRYGVQPVEVLMLKPNLSIESMFLSFLNCYATCVSLSAALSGQPSLTMYFSPLPNLSSKDIGRDLPQCLPAHTTLPKIFPRPQHPLNQLSPCGLSPNLIVV